ncbi:MAG: 23S rRNA (guanosine(2251)-2'-O)-methyltransferase RlmB [Bacilli bacterium]|nr:23S rRNA (guanosine(2251)-2'-O)-methyltransferase RlmB [Bacilli bacterium]
MYIYGKNVVKSALESNTKINKIFLSKSFDDQDILNGLKKTNLKFNIRQNYEMDKMVDAMHQGVILDVEDYKYADLSVLDNLEDALIVMLDHIEDPHNFGAIIRTCEAAGVDAIIIPKDRACDVNSTVIKTSTGTINNMNIIRVTNLNQTIKYLKDNGYWIVGTDMEGTDYSKIDYKGKTCIIIGNEGKGISELVEKNCDFIASIPMYGKVNSLNASVATAIVIFEAVKARHEL